LGYEKIKEILNSDDMRLRNDYLYTLKNWSYFYGPSQFKLCFFEDLTKNPDKLLNEIFVFILGKKCTCKIHSQKKNFENKINSAPCIDLDNDLKKIIAMQVYPNLQRLCSEIGGYPCEWLKAAQAILVDNI
jgi:hypothetical protein